MCKACSSFRDLGSNSHWVMFIHLWMWVMCWAYDVLVHKYHLFTTKKLFLFTRKSHSEYIPRTKNIVWIIIKSEPELILDSTPKVSFSIWNRQKSGNHNFFTLILWFPIHIQTIIWSFYCRRSNGVYARWHEFFKW